MGLVISVYNKIECNYVAILLSCACMRSRPFILRCAAFLLILVFSQKAGAGLFVHNLLHSGNTAKEFPVKQHDNSKELSYSCTCIDDFLLPFNGNEEQVYFPPVSNPKVPDTIFEDRIPFHASILFFLRGPPARKV
jgi:hypothetical protein